ncbi:GNAT family N-acetyltransferase [Schlesneria sp. T3-172]|uniref:GNAT family N-acetyltransferase n=1 Tax=Schlesneria sphaerica TaxID=3373610 RepID=UPI0037C8A466
MRCDFIGPDSSLWGRFLADCTHDFYHLPQYVTISAQDRMCAPNGDGSPLAFHAEDDHGRRFLLTFIVRPVPASCSATEALYDAITPYGYACPLVINPDQGPIEPFLQQAISRLKECLSERRIIAAFSRSHPNIPLPLEPLRQTGTVVEHGQTVSIDLTLPLEELWHQTRAGHRSEINRARKKGFTVEIQSDWRDFDEFFRAYTETMQRVNANEHYFFSREYFAQLRASIGDVLHLAICHKEGAVTCGALFSEVCGIVQYHLSGTTEEFHSQYPTKVMLDSVRTWAKERGNHTMHLGGGYGGSEDSLFQFKAGFSHLRSPFYTWRLIADPVTYQDLCRQWEARSGKTASPPDAFFPAYRAP